ncbi:hypothetical protein HID58_080033 [Brassica napus]|uniref:Uncharacterized protein n=1 Tax=Brassica napus TaxID=3708 RepID=A0ABQ7Y3R3_BRANA|nr:hypothetical protein HID58_080033 [Brassica napus]
MCFHGLRLTFKMAKILFSGQTTGAPLETFKSLRTQALESLQQHLSIILSIQLDQSIQLLSLVSLNDHDDYYEWALAAIPLFSFSTGMVYDLLKDHNEGSVWEPLAARTYSPPIRTWRPILDYLQAMTKVAPTIGLAKLHLLPLDREKKLDPSTTLLFHVKHFVYNQFPDQK